MRSYLHFAVVYNHQELKSLLNGLPLNTRPGFEEYQGGELLGPGHGRPQKE